MEHAADLMIEEGKKLGLEFNGWQGRVNRPALMMFTRKNIGTFVINENETVAEAVKRKEIQFGITEAR